MIGPSLLKFYFHSSYSQGGRKAAQLARDLGVSTWNLRDWKRRYGAGVAVATAVEFAAVQRELATLRRQNDIFKPGSCNRRRGKSGSVC